MSAPTATEIRLTIESFTGSTNAEKRAAIYAQWKEIASQMRSGARTISLPGLSGSIYGDDIKDYYDLLTACLAYLDGLIGEDPVLSSADPMASSMNFNRPMMF